MNATNMTPLTVEKYNGGAIPAQFQPYAVLCGNRLVAKMPSNTEADREMAQLFAASPKMAAALSRLIVQAQMTDEYTESTAGTLRSAVDQAIEALQLARD